MILFCECENSSADCLYGKEKRPHSKLTTIPTVSSQKEYACDMCYFVRTLARGKQTGKKAK